jgi:phosphatidate cytidylyltransferase
VNLQRVATAVVLVPTVVACVWLGPTWLLAVLLGGVILLALYEFFKLAETSGIRGYPRWVFVCAAWIVFEQWSATAIRSQALRGGESLVHSGGAFSVPLEIVLVVFALGAGCIALGSRRPLNESLPALGTSAGGLVLVALPMSYIVRIHGVERLGPRLLLFLLCLIWVGDTLAYYVGRAIGRLPMAPVISPKKTWEGAAANLIGSVLVAWPFAGWLGVELTQLMSVAAIANIAGQIGDLVESSYKRGAGVKDSGTLLPGHGGVLDRIDSLIFAAPVVWCYVWIVLKRS